MEDDKTNKPKEASKASKAFKSKGTSKEKPEVEIKKKDSSNASASAATSVTSASTPEALKLNTLFAFKEGMFLFYDGDNAVPATLLRYEPWSISQIKTQEKEAYVAIQLACRPKKASQSNKAEKGHLRSAGFIGGAAFVREVRCSELPEGVKVGQTLALDVFQKGDLLQVSSLSKGRGFAGVMKRYGFGGGPAAHGSTFHRQPGSVANRASQGRVMPGKKNAGSLWT